MIQLHTHTHILFHYGLLKDIEYTVPCAIQQDFVVYIFYI